MSRSIHVAGSVVSIMLMQLNSFLTSGRLWSIKCLIVCLVAAACFSCAPAIWMYGELDLPPAYQLKSEHPFADTATLTIPEHPGERSHGAKLTPRLLSSVLLFASSQLSQHPYLPATIGGIVYLLCGLIVPNKLTNDRRTALFAGLLLAGLYTTNACFSMNHGPKPFDGIALGMVALTLILIDRPWLFAISAYLSCWTDERAIVSLVLIAALVVVRESFQPADRQIRIVILGGAVLIYGFTRLVAGRVFGWTGGDVSMLGDNLVASLSYSQMAAWCALEGGWILVASAAWLALRRKRSGDAIVLVGSTAIAILSCLLVLDISRAAAFGFPTIFIAIAVLKKHSGLAVNSVRRTTALAAVVSLVANNIEVISSIAYSPLPTTPIVILLRWMNP